MTLVVTIVARDTPGMNEPGARAVIAVITGGILLVSLFCGWTAVDLFRMRVWARYSILILGGMEFLFCALMTAVMILVRSAPLPASAATPTPLNMHAMLVGLAVTYGLFSLIGAWWLVYFNLAPVRHAFADARQTGGMPAQGVGEGQIAMAAPQEAGTPAWRIVIIVWASLMLFGAVSLPMVMFLHVPLFLFGLILRGAAANAVVLLLVAVQLYLAAGLLMKWKPGWYLGLAWQIYTIVYFLTFLLPGMWGRFTAYQQDMMGRWGFTVTGPNVTTMVDPWPFIAMGLIAAIAMAAVMTWALVRRREDYLGARNSLSLT